MEPSICWTYDATPALPLPPTPFGQSTEVSSPTLLFHSALHHRAGNLFQVIQSIANRTSGWSDKYEKERFIGRLQALARTNAVLIENAWQSAPLARVVEDELVALSERLELCGCDIARRPYCCSGLCVDCA
jgi:hypothetical protein